MSSDQVSFSITEPRFDKNTYAGRVMSISESTSPKYAFKTVGQIEAMQKLLTDQKAKEKEQFDKTGSYKLMISQDEKQALIDADNVVTSAVHPDTNKALPWIMRISSFMPMNIPLNVGFILAPPTLFNTVFVQVVNQTYNATMNYGNANASSPYTLNDLGKSFAAAVCASTGVALAIRQINAKRSAAATGARLIMLNAITSTTACACGGFANNYFMRMAELERGIELVDPDTREPIGKSKLCAQKAVMQTASSRIFMALPISLPAFALIAMERAKLVPANKYANMVLQISLICGQLLIAVPAAIGAFPQMATVKAADLEPEFQGLRSKVKGDLITEFTYNKGM